MIGSRSFKHRKTGEDASGERSIQMHQSSTNRLSAHLLPFGHLFFVHVVRQQLLQIPRIALQRGRLRQQRIADFAATALPVSLAARRVTLDHHARGKTKYRSKEAPKRRRAINASKRGRRRRDQLVNQTDRRLDRASTDPLCRSVGVRRSFRRSVQQQFI